jgi:nucleotide-binding universal stress UspA family protein
MFHNILVCVDGSVHAERALEESIDLAVAGQARLTILTAIPRPPYWAAAPGTIPSLEPLTTDLARDSRRTLRAAVERVPESVPVTSILSEKPIREALIQRLRSGDHDLLVMGSRGRGAFTASVLGSVSHYALNHSPVPVLIVRTVQDRARLRAEETDPALPAAA